MDSIESPQFKTILDLCLKKPAKAFQPYLSMYWCVPVHNPPKQVQISILIPQHSEKQEMKILQNRKQEIPANPCWPNSQPRVKNPKQNPNRQTKQTILLETLTEIKVPAWSVYLIFLLFLRSRCKKDKKCPLQKSLDDLGIINRPFLCILFQVSIFGQIKNFTTTMMCHYRVVFVNSSEIFIS